MLPYSAAPATGATRSRRRPAGKLSAAEIGTAHHVFLQTMPLDAPSDRSRLSDHAASLVREHALTPDEAAAVDVDAIDAFWASETGKAILPHAERVRREVPFTARLDPADIAAFGTCPNAAELDGEYFVVRGAVDLLVLLPDQLWILDYKTDRFDQRGFDEKLAGYSRQLGLYALALHRIYRRPVTKRWLHFLADGRTIDV